MNLSLERMEAFVSAWEEKLPCVHVVGTNGKGSTSVFLESIARSHGLITGSYTSPHFCSVRERIRINGRMIPEAGWVEAANALYRLCPDLELTYFEWLTCLAALTFHARSVDIAVMEAGLGGRFDATRVFAPKLVLLTPVGLDHEAYLGDTLAKVADDKSRAITAGSRAITVPQEPEVMDVYERRAQAVGADLSVSLPLYHARLGLAGGYQPINAGLAMEGWRAWCDMNEIAFDEQAASAGLANAWLPGRFQMVRPDLAGPRFTLDGAHNGHGLRALKQSLDAAGIQPDAVIFGCMRDKNLDEVREPVRGLTSGTILATGILDNDRAMAPKELASVLEHPARAVPDMKAALADVARLGAENVIVCGSLYLLAEFYKLHPALLENGNGETL